MSQPGSRRAVSATKPQAYKTDLAYIHNVGFGNFAEGIAPGILQILRQGGIDGGLIVDLGCGGGLWARRLIDSGYRVLGIDLSPEMVAWSRKRVPEGLFCVGSFFDVDLPDCAAITSLGECLNRIFDRRDSRSSLGRLFHRAFEALQLGGLFIFDVAEPGRARGSDRRFWQGTDWACLTQFVPDEPQRRLTRQITTFRKVGRYYRRAAETHVQQLYRAS